MVCAFVRSNPRPTFLGFISDYCYSTLPNLKGGIAIFSLGSAVGSCLLSSVGLVALLKSRENPPLIFIYWGGPPCFTYCGKLSIFISSSGIEMIAPSFAMPFRLSLPICGGNPFWGKFKLGTYLSISVCFGACDYWPWYLNFLLSSITISCCYWYKSPSLS